MLDTMLKFIFTVSDSTVSGTDLLTTVTTSGSDLIGATATEQGIPFVLRLLGIILAGILTENYVLSKFLGCCPFLGVSKKLDTALGMSAAVIFVMVLATAVTYPIFSLLSSVGIDYLETIVFILVIAALVQLVEIVLKKLIPSLYKSLGVYLPLITTNCAVLGVTMNVIEKYFGIYVFGEGYIAALCTALGAGVGFLVAMVLFAGVRGRLEQSDIPDFFKGLPITLISASIVALSFMGFSGVIGGLGLA